MDYALIMFAISLGVLSIIVIDIFRLEMKYKRSRRERRYGRNVSNE